MAKSGVYLNGKELLECELEKLDRVEKVQAMVETNERQRIECLKAVARPFDKYKNND
jgi:hypothetical protein